VGFGRNTATAAIILSHLTKRFTTISIIMVSSFEKQQQRRCSRRRRSRCAAGVASLRLLVVLTMATTDIGRSYGYCYLAARTVRAGFPAPAAPSLKTVATDLLHPTTAQRCHRSSRRQRLISDAAGCASRNCRWTAGIFPHHLRHPRFAALALSSQGAPEEEGESDGSSPTRRQRRLTSPAFFTLPRKVGLACGSALGLVLLAASPG